MKISSFVITLAILFGQSAVADTEVGYCRGIYGPDGSVVHSWLFQDLKLNYYLSFDQNATTKIPMKQISTSDSFPKTYSADDYNVILNGNSEGAIGSVDYGGFPNFANCYNSGEG